MRHLTILTGLVLSAGLAHTPLARAEGGEVEHFATIEQAVEAAKGRDILVDFTGSDWCGWCIKLNSEVFSQDAWKAAAAARYVFVELDFPRKTQLAPEQKAYNDKQQARFGIRGFPTILVLDSTGTLYASTGYQAGGPEAYVKHLAEFGTRKAEIADLRAKVAAAPAADKLGHVTTLLGKLAEWKIDSAYTELKEQVVALDTTNSTGKRIDYAKELAFTAGTQGHTEKFGTYLGIVKAADPAVAAVIEVDVFMKREVEPLAIAKDWDGAVAKLATQAERSGEAGQKVCYLMGACRMQQGKTDEARPLLEKALALAPESNMAKQLTKMLERLNKSK